jgi:hypothetical protein
MSKTCEVDVTKLLGLLDMLPFRQAAAILSAVGLNSLSVSEVNTAINFFQANSTVKLQPLWDESYDPEADLEKNE